MRHSLFALLTVATQLAVAPAWAGRTEGPSSYDVLGGHGRIYKPNDERKTSQAVSVSDLPLVHTAQVLPLNSAGKIIGATRRARRWPRR